MVNGHLFFVLSVQPFNFIGRGRKSMQNNGGFKNRVKFLVGGMFVMETKPNAIPGNEVKLS